MLLDMAGEDRRLSDQDTGDESSEHGVDPDEMGDQRQCRHHQQHGGDDGHLADKIVVDPADDQEHRPPPQREAGDKEEGGAEHAGSDRCGIDPPVLGKAEDHGHDDPADGVVDDGGGDDDLAHGAAHEIHVAHHHGDDFHRGDRERHAQKQRSDKPPSGIGQHGVRHKLAEDEAAGEGQRDARDGNAERGAAHPVGQRQVGFHPRQQQQQQDAELGNGVDHALLLADVGEQPVLRLRPQHTEHGGTEQDAREQLAHHGRLADAQHRLAENTPGEQ